MNLTLNVQEEVDRLYRELYKFRVEYRMQLRATWPERYRQTLFWAGGFNWLLNASLLYFFNGGKFQLGAMLLWSVAIGLGVVAKRRWRARSRLLALELVVSED